MLERLLGPSIIPKHTALTSATGRSVSSRILLLHQHHKRAALTDEDGVIFPSIFKHSRTLFGILSPSAPHDFLLTAEIFLPALPSTFQPGEFPLFFPAR